VTASFDRWKEGNVKPAKYDVPVLPAREKK
jgi:hypothetical protein